MQTAIRQLLLLEFNNKTLLIGSAILFAAISLISLYLENPLLPLLFILLPVMVFVGLKSLQVPFIVLCVICVASYLGNTVHLIEDAAIPFSLFQVFYLLGLVIFVVSRFISARFRIYVTGIELEILLFYTIVFFHTIYTPNPEFGLFYAGRVVFLSLFVYLILNSIRSFRQVTILFICIIVAALAVALISVRDVLVNPEVAAMRFVFGQTERLVARARVGQVDPNIFATFFFLPISFVVSLILSESSKKIKLISFLALPVLLLGIISTFSRSAWVALILMLVLIGVIYKKYNIFGYAIMILVLAFVLVEPLRDNVLEVINRFAGLFTGGLDDSNRIRVILLAWSLKTFFSNYMFGLGFGGYGTAFNREYDGFETLEVSEAHNEIALIAVEMGLIGLFFFAMIVFRVLQTAYQNIKNSTNELEKALSVSVFGSLIAFAIFYQFIAETLTDNNIWMLTGFAFTIRMLQNKAISKSDSSAATAT